MDNNCLNTSAFTNFPPSEWGWSEQEWSEQENEVYRSEDHYLVNDIFEQLNDKFNILAFSPSKHNDFIKTQKINDEFKIIAMEK
jgi:hypothetical protein